MRNYGVQGGGGNEDSLTMLLQVDLKVTSFVFSLQNYRLKKYKNVLL